ncbi:MAG: hypothetical protein ABJM73_11155 [Parasphingorhabdus sp.]|uniref:hypothetical protein n=1 Tax=Parasphingorhabdus sp. TaxID=2709688 RepID=UPI003299E14E
MLHIDAAGPHAYLSGSQGPEAPAARGASHGEASDDLIVSLSMWRPKRQCGLP